MLFDFNRKTSANVCFQDKALGGVVIAVSFANYSTHLNPLLHHLAGAL